ncbi:MAG: PorV/PorQ family protein [Candidatus Delongbacteria bacterium]|nr:PorV/PorQ family protein [Candidatus Delongbacteria bacterium]
MNRFTFRALLTGLLLIGTGLLTVANAREKLAQTGMQFLSVATDARAAGMGEATTTLDMQSTSLFFNPAGMANLNAISDFTFTQINWIADIDLNAFAVAFSPANGKYGVLGFSLISAQYGDIEGTMVYANPQGYIDTEIMKPSGLSVGVGYARALSNKFSIGGQIKYIDEYLAKSVIPGTDGLEVKKNTASAFAFDFGTLFNSGYKNLTVGMSVRNFSQEITYEDEGFQLPLAFRIGLSIDVMEFFPNLKAQRHSLYTALEAIHPRDHSEQLNLGAEYSFMQTFYGRAGYMFNRDECGVSLGFGLKKYGFSIDYGYTPYGLFDNVQRITFRFCY